MKSYYTTIAHATDRRNAAKMARFVSRRDSVLKVICGSIAAAATAALWCAVFALA